MNMYSMFIVIQGVFECGFYTRFTVFWNFYEILDSFAPTVPNTLMLR